MNDYNLIPDAKSTNWRPYEILKAAMCEAINTEGPCNVTLGFGAECNILVSAYFNLHGQSDLTTEWTIRYNTTEYTPSESFQNIAHAVHRIRQIMAQYSGMPVAGLSVSGG